MTVSVSLGFSKGDIAEAVQRNDVIIVIDVLRCCSTIVAVLVNGADGVIPTETVKEARMLHKKHPEFILAGERRGNRPWKFDLGNSPLEFSPGQVDGKHIILTTTNGTKALISSQKARYVFIGALLNAETTARRALEVADRDETGITLISAGTNGRFSLEDFICAGAIAEAFLADKIEYSDAVSAASLAFREAQKALNMVVQSGLHARYLIGQGFDEDVKFCSQLNIYTIVPFLKGRTIVPWHGSILFH